MTPSRTVMTQLATLFRPAPRQRAAARRLTAAESGFELSLIALRKAAFDHVDRHTLLSIALQATLEHLVAHGLARP